MTNTRFGFYLLEFFFLVIKSFPFHDYLIIQVDLQCTSIWYSSISELIMYVPYNPKIDKK